MDLYDHEKAALVWQRVRSSRSEGVTTECLTRFILQLRQLSSAYRTMSTQVPPIHSATLRSLSDRKRAQATCLRGLHLLAFGPCPELQLSRQKTEPLLAALRRCWAAEQQLLTQFEIHCADLSHGPIFATLSAEQKAHCRSILHLVGMLEQ